MTKLEAISELRSMSHKELNLLVGELHIEQYGQLPDPNVTLDSEELIKWILNHYEWKDVVWKSKRYIVDAVKDFMYIHEYDMHPARVLH